MCEESNTKKYGKEWTDDIVLRDSQVIHLGIELSNIRKFSTGKRVVICYLVQTLILIKKD